VANTSLNKKQLVTNSSFSAVNITQLSKILLRRRFVILGISCVVISVASLLPVTTKPKYQSSMQILMNSNLYEEVRPSNIQEGAGSELANPNIQVADYTAQMKLMLSTELIEKAVTLLRPDYPNITLEDIKGKKGKGKKAPLEVTKLEEKVGDNQVFSQVIKVSFNDNDPVKAQRVLQALQKVYQDYNIEEQKERLNKGLAFVNVRLPEIKKKVSQAE
jgi:polysaccharide biosynthesis transport protein